LARVLIATPAPEKLSDGTKQLLATFKPDLILSEFGMPGKDGYDFMRELRSLGVKTPAIALTACARSEDRIRLLQAGYQNHLPKPVEAGLLIDVVANLAAESEAMTREPCE